MTSLCEFVKPFPVIFLLSQIENFKAYFCTKRPTYLAILIAALLLQQGQQPKHRIVKRLVDQIQWKRISSNEGKCLDLRHFVAFWKMLEIAGCLRGRAPGGTERVKRFGRM